MPQNNNHIPKQTEPEHSFSEMDVRSEQVQEIIGRPPHWLIRWGVSAFFGVLLLVLLSASIIRYPETVVAPLKLTAIYASQSLESRVNGKIIHIAIENNTYVEEGTILAWIESTANHEEVLQLSGIIDGLRSQLIGELNQDMEVIDMTLFRNLGELQNVFQGFEQVYREYRSYAPGEFYSRQRESLVQELNYSRQLQEMLYEQEQIQQDDYRLARREFEMQKQLADNGFIAPVELTRAERELASRQLPLQQTESSIITNQVSQIAKEREILELDKRIEEQESVFLQSLNIMKSAIDEWERNYLIKAPFRGTIVYAGIIQENQTVSTGEEVFYLQPENTYYFGELSVSQQSFGRVQEGQQVMVRFNGYPYHEFGSVYGEVEYFSQFPIHDSLFFAKVSFPDGLLTSYGNEIPPRNGMTGQAEIITQDTKLLERVYNNITKDLR